eukprot:CAMPEP_0114630206 /NCGR_PEP_ID=MMETSP0168-20121206/13763_1 /TAXON_ID=95228 ORGANISM="Vannella sp., Strain DIVA3 517/6/12" /NCGR_SAMPLE_ID=MMETSP0168 /ASSEMBLY_ACC=CAM_ASM_000044 /LENGTH=32 /DNA_ID= /DNA_START= /DNA_END= /DNA_ORIENTATION=
MGASGRGGGSDREGDAKPPDIATGEAGEHQMA